MHRQRGESINQHDRQVRRFRATRQDLRRSSFKRRPRSGRRRYVTRSGVALRTRIDGQPRASHSILKRGGFERLMNRIARRRVSQLECEHLSGG